MIPTIEKALEMLMEHTKSDQLIVHAKTVSGVMRHFARINNEDEALWGAVGMLHDIDYEKYPDQHCVKAVEILKEYDVDEAFIRAVVSHGYGICSDTVPVSLMEKTLFAIDELTGIIQAAAILRPSRSVMDLELKSVKKKYKTRAFAAGCNRDIIEKGAEMLNMPLDELIHETILGMREVADEIGLDIH